jgi:uncharacterized protein involved in exopolysaccharide biosynthesis
MENQHINQVVQEEIKLSDYIRIIVQYRYLVVLIFTLVLAATVIYTARQPKVYSSSSRVLIENQKNTSDLMLFATPGVGTNALNNQIEMMKSLPLGNRAAEIMKKHRDWESFPISQSASPGALIKARMKVESKRETDILTISYESTSQSEAKLQLMRLPKLYSKRTLSMQGLNTPRSVSFWKISLMPFHADCKARKTTCANLRMPISW